MSAIAAELSAAQVSDNWQEVGPVNRRRYFGLTDFTACPTAERLVLFLKSQFFSSYLSSLTALSFTGSNIELRRFTRGCYTLMRDDDPERFEEALDVDFFFYLPVLDSDSVAAPSLDEDWDSEKFGGALHYVEAEAEDALVSVEPKSNALSLVYRAGNGGDVTAPGVMRFVEYLTHHSPQDRCDVSMILRIASDDEEEEEDDDV